MKFSKILFENVRHIFQNQLKFILKFFEMVFEIFRYNSQNFQKYLSKISELFLLIILRNFPKHFPKMSEVFLEISEIFEMIFEIFRNNSQNFPKYFSKCYEIILNILTFLKFFKIILKISAIFLVTSRNISGSFQKF